MKRDGRGRPWWPSTKSADGIRVLFTGTGQLNYLFGRLRETPMEPSWKHADVFPIIVRIIEEAHRELQQFVTAQEIATRLLQDTEARNLIEAAREQLEDKQSLEWLANNMVSWFSQRISVGKSDWARSFERTKINGLWAYKPIAAAEF